MNRRHTKYRAVRLRNITKKLTSARAYCIYVFAKLKQEINVDFGVKDTMNSSYNELNMDLSLSLYVLIYVPNASKDLLLFLEQNMLDKGKPEYSIQPNANSSAGRILSEEHKAKIAASRENI
jgi:hypothetical protein